MGILLTEGELMIVGITFLVSAVITWAGLTSGNYLLVIPFGFLCFVMLQIGAF